MKKRSTYYYKRNITHTKTNVGIGKAVVLDIHYEKPRQPVWQSWSGSIGHF